MDLSPYWDMLRRRGWMLPLGVLLAVALSLAVDGRTTRVYQATAKLLINQVQIPGLNTYPDTLDPDRRAKTDAEILRSRPVLEDTIAQLSLPATVDDLDRRLTVEHVRDTQVLQVSVRDTDPARAAATANKLAQVFIARNRDLQAGSGVDARRQVDQELEGVRQKINDTTERLSRVRATPQASPVAGATSGEASGEAARLQGELTQYQDLYFRLLETQQRMALVQAQAISSVSVAEPAQAPTKPIHPRPLRDAGLAGLAGIVLATGLLLAVEYFDDRVRDPEELRRRFNVTPLMTLGRRRGRGALLRPRAAGGQDHFSEALRLLRTNLDFLIRGETRVIGVTSPVANEGKSTVAANLALVEAQAGKRVVLIDADMREPSLHRLFGVKNFHGLSTYLAQPTPSAQPPLQAGPLGIHILTSGPIPPNPAELLGSRRMAELVDGLRTRADVVIFDSVPILPVADTLVLQRHLDGTILVMDVSRTKTKTLERALRSLRQVSANVLGVVLNEDKWRVGSDDYGYAHHGADEDAAAKRLGGTAIQPAVPVYSSALAGAMTERPGHD